MNTLTDAQSAYLAGFFDGKGCISITKTQGSANRTPSYVLRVIFSQSGEKGLVTLTAFQNMTGLGTLNHYTSSQYGTMQHEWRLVSLDAGKCLEAMCPYLVIKKDQALIALRFCKVIEANPHGGRGYTVPPEVIEQKETCYIALRLLKNNVGEPLVPEYVVRLLEVTEPGHVPDEPEQLTDQPPN